MNKRAVNREPHIASNILHCLLLQPEFTLKFD
uniref:NAD-dependent malic enzyme 59 kDa isoform-like n=1 Tax=Rhizophora mucronata TaxID=61149 RepID=A0A2P2KWE4_RHIMU